jgi:glycerol transport system ATP-binding protein
MTLVLDAVSKTVNGQFWLDGVSMELRPGTLNVLLGRTLAGKTTLMRLMAGLEPVTGGRILADGKDVTGASVRQRDVAVVYQQFINYPLMTVYDNIASPLRRQGLAREEIDRRVRRTAAMLQIGGLLDRYPAQLSGGQQQRTAIGRALAKGASLLLLDEPLVNLDYKLREELRTDLRSLFGGGRTIVVYATTDPVEALILGGNTAVLHEGRLLQHGPTLDVFNHPASLTSADVFSDPPLNVLDAMVAGDRAVLGDGTLLPVAAHLPSGPCRIGLRANHLSVARRSERDVALATTVRLAEITGSETFIHAEHDGDPLVVREEGVHRYDVGDPLSVFLDPARVFVFAPDGRLLTAPGDAAALQGVA